MPFLHIFRNDKKLLELRKSGAGRDKMTDDNILLESEQCIDLCLNRGFGKYLRRLLEACRRDEALCRQSCLSNSEKYRLAKNRLCRTRFRRSLAFFLEFACDFLEAFLIDHLRDLELRIAALGNKDGVAKNVVLDRNFLLIDLVILKHQRIAGACDVDFAKHLADDDLDMLIGDLHALHTIDFLNFIDKILLQLRQRP